MTYLFLFYWFCAGLASFSINEAEPEVHFIVRLVLSLLVGGVMVPVRIMAKMAS